MFALGGRDFPSDVSGLSTALAGGFEQAGVAARVEIEGALPALALLRVDVSGARFSRAHRPAAGTGTEPGFFARSAELVARPARLESLPFTALLRVEDAVFAYARAGAEPVLALDRCGRGTLDFSVARADVQAALRGFASAAAEAQGAELRSLTLAWSAAGPLALALRVEAVARAMFMDAKVSASARVELDAALNARVCGISVAGQGAAGTLAATFLKRKAAEFDGRCFPLGGLVAAGVALRSVSLAVGEALELHAELAPAPATAGDSAQ